MCAVCHIDTGTGVEKNGCSLGDWEVLFVDQIFLKTLIDGFKFRYFQQIKNFRQEISTF